MTQGNLSAAEKLGRDAFQDHSLREDRINLAYTSFLLAYVARVKGQYEEARHYARHGFEQATVIGDEFVASYCLIHWGRASHLLGDMADAKRRFHASYAIQKDFKDRRGMSTTLTNLGRIALLEGDNAEARRCYEQAWTLYIALGNKVGLATSLEGMGNSACATGHYREARRYLREALQYTSDPVTPLTLSILIGIGELLLQTGRRTRGIELLALALHHPISEQDTKDVARRLLNRYQATGETAQPPSDSVDLNAVATTLLDELLIPEDMPLTRQTPEAGETLIEPLSERELEVLRFIADDHSNREIAEKLFLSVATVKWYLTHIYGKLGVQNRTLAIMRARQLDLLP
jgi:ATP/maltotriose-dependent transcriptional regulator MalT